MGQGIDLSTQVRYLIPYLLSYVQYITISYYSGDGTNFVVV